MSDVGGIASERLKSFVGRIRNLRAEGKGIAEDIKEVYAEVKGTGFDTKIVRKIVSWMDAHENNAADQQEQEALFELYKEAMGYGEGSGRDLPLKPPSPKKGKKAEKAPEVDERQTDIEQHLQQGESSDTDLQPASDLQPAEPERAPVSADEAKGMGRDAGAAGVPITGNPFDAADPNRGHWELGWCEATGSDGMDIPADLQAPAPVAAQRGKGSRKKGSTPPPNAASEGGAGADGEWQTLENDFRKKG